MSESRRALLLVAVNTDQPEIQRRLEMILAACWSIKSVGTAEVLALELGHSSPALNALTASAYEHLAAVFGEEAMQRLNVGSLVGPAEGGDLHAV